MYSYNDLNSRSTVSFIPRRTVPGYEARVLEEVSYYLLVTASFISRRTVPGYEARVLEEVTA